MKILSVANTAWCRINLCGIYSITSMKQLQRSLPEAALTGESILPVAGGQQRSILEQQSPEDDSCLDRSDTDNYFCKHLLLMNFIGLCIFSTAEDTSCKKHVGSFSMSFCDSSWSGHRILNKDFKKDQRRRRRWTIIFQSLFMGG